MRSVSRGGAGIWEAVSAAQTGEAKKQIPHWAAASAQESTTDLIRGDTHVRLVWACLSGSGTVNIDHSLSLRVYLPQT